MIEVKICGLTNRDDALAALDAGADYLGFVLYPKSPRGITPARMATILDGLGRPCRAVAVFVNVALAEVVRIASDCGLHAAQIHGDEPAEDFAGAPLPLWRAVRLEQGLPQPAPDAWRAERYVVDAAAPGLYGGSGEVADWLAVADFAGGYPTMLAGGLTPGNVADAVRAVRPLGVDVASGVEAEAGRKAIAKVRAFIRAAKSA